MPVELCRDDQNRTVPPSWQWQPCIELSFCRQGALLYIHGMWRPDLTCSVHHSSLSSLSQMTIPCGELHIRLRSNCHSLLLAVVCRASLVNVRCLTPRMPHSTSPCRSSNSPYNRPVFSPSLLVAMTNASGQEGKKREPTHEEFANLHLSLNASLSRPCSDVCILFVKALCPHWHSSVASVERRLVKRWGLSALYRAELRGTAHHVTASLVHCKTISFPIPYSTFFSLRRLHSDKLAGRNSGFQPNSPVNRAKPVLGILDVKLWGEEAFSHPQASQPASQPLVLLYQFGCTMSSSAGTPSQGAGEQASSDETRSQGPAGQALGNGTRSREPAEQTLSDGTRFQIAAEQAEDIAWAYWFRMCSGDASLSPLSHTMVNVAGTLGLFPL